MKRFIFLCGSILFIGISSGNTYISPDIVEYEEHIMKSIKTNSENKNNCEDFEIINKALNSLKKYDFFDKNNIGEGKYFQMFHNAANSRTPINTIMKSLFPYVNKEYLEKNEGLFTSCEKNESILIAGGFQSRGKIVLKTKRENFQYEGKTFPLEITEIYFQTTGLNNKISKFLYNKDGLILLGCSTNQKQYISPHFAYIKKNHSGEASNYQIYQRFYLEGEKNQELTQYSGENITINFYVEPSILSENSTLECENSWMLKYEIIQDGTDY